LSTFDELVRVVPYSFDEVDDVERDELLFTLALLLVVLRELLLFVVDEDERLLLLFGVALRVYVAGVVLLR